LRRVLTPTKRKIGILESNRFMEIMEVLNLHKIIVMNRRGYNPPLKNFHNINLVPGVVENLHK